jgi:hypothetical protein
MFRVLNTWVKVGNLQKCNGEFCLINSQIISYYDQLPAD